ncbi:MAG: undecaprenyl-diphosphate phosphatase [Bacillota bacterium]|nr:undecaprenyl-diphosphate phosphatase [Bacillota bacterium]
MFHFLTAIFMGIVEGLTEFLPVSSTGHLILTGDLLHFNGDIAKTFEIVIQLGSILAVVVVYWRRFVDLIVGVFSKKNKNGLNLLHIILAMLPAVIIGLVLHDAIKTYLFSSTTVVVGLIAGGILMILAEQKKSAPSTVTLDTLTYKQSFFIGLYQCLALWPGFSRSGSTIAGGLIVGTNHKVAAEFSFIVAVPMMIAASGLDLLKSYKELSSHDIPFFLVGFLAAFIVALIAIRVFLNLISRVKLKPFAYYRFILAAVFILYMLFK